MSLQPSESLEQINSVAEASSIPPLRERNMTEKGRDYQISLLENGFKAALSSWRRQSIKLSVLSSDCEDRDNLRDQRDLLMSLLDELGKKFQRLKNLKDDVSSESNKFENVEEEHQRLMQLISARILELGNQEFETRSNISYRSNRSRLSKSSNNSEISKISNAAARQAALKAELRFIDIESKYKAELQKIQTIKKMEIVGAEIQAMEEVLDKSDTKFDVKPNISLLPDGKTDFVENYIETHTQTVTPVSILSDPQQMNPVIASLSVPSNINMSHCPQSTENQSTFLNPSVHAFVPSHDQLGSPQCTWVYDSALPSTTHANTSVISNSTRAPLNNECTNSTSACQGSHNKTEQGLVELAQTLANQVSLGRLPSPEPNVFNGDPLAYPGWKSAFQILIEQRNIPPPERIHYLKRYLSSSVKDVIEGFFLLSSDEAYVEAKRTLDRRYGDPFIIANAFRDKLDKWPKIQPRDGTGLQKFADFLQQCLIAMQTIGSLNVLNDDRENKRLLTKLPDWIISRWGRIVSVWREERNAFPPFWEFVDFVTKEARIACDPVTSLQSLKPVAESQKPKMSNRQQKGSSSSSSFLSEIVENDKDSSSSENKANKSTCIICKGSHDLGDCRSFFAMSLKERKEFIKGKKLCFACLQSGHISKKCRHRKKCKICSKYHPTSLHGDTKEMQNQRNTTSHEGSESKSKESPSLSFTSTHSGTTFLSDVTSGSKCSSIVPVYVSHCDSPDKERLVYALLDTQSDTTFILEDTCTALGVTGTEVKLSLSTMHAEDKIVTSHKVKGLNVRGFDSQVRISLPDAYTRNIMPANRNHIPTPNIANLWPHLEGIANCLVPLKDCEIGLLIGYNCPRALLPREVVASCGDAPYGLRTDLGWSVVGVVDPNYCGDESFGVTHHIVSREVTAQYVPDKGNQHSPVLFSFRSKVKEVVSSDILKIMESEFSDSGIDGTALSQEDQRFLSVLSDGISFENGHYAMPLPFKDHDPYLPNNKSLALSRLRSLRNRLERDEVFRQHYTDFMHELLKNKHAEMVPESELNTETGKLWYIPHHGIYHPQKPGKIRVVFDCSANFHGESLNSHLLQGPDLTNTLVGVLCRFRKERVAFTCDIEKMFHQFKVNPDHRNYLRFLWWNDNNYRKEPVEYRMTVHLFGAKSSPGCANFGFKRVAQDNQDVFGKNAADFICRNFYVDDGLKSVPNVNSALSLIDKSKAMCVKGGLRLHKFVSNSKEVIQYLEPEDRAKDLKDINLALDKLPVERTLGVLWCIESDTFQFRIVLKDCPLTRRGILSTVCSMFDPLGFIAPVVLIGKQILQQMCANQADWDDPLPDELHVKWDKWRRGLKDLELLKIERCVKPDGFGIVQFAEVHHFSDASSSGYGQCSFLRLLNERGNVHCSFLMGKSRVVPLKPITIPRLELSAAVLSVKVGGFLDLQLDYENLCHFYWTDSTVVLGYLSNEARRFHVYVANRIQRIKNQTNPSQWRYVSSHENPADLASRGVTAKEFLNESRWFSGPEFLWKQELPEPKFDHCKVNTDDPELKQGACFISETKETYFASILERIQYFSDWHRAKRALAICLKFKEKLYNHAIKGSTNEGYTESLRPDHLHNQLVTVSDLQRAESEIIISTQCYSFRQEIETLRSGKVVGIPSNRQELSFRRKVLNGKSQLFKLDPFLDQKGILRVGGRLQNSRLSYYVKHPVILPHKGHVTDLVIKFFHAKVKHQGRGITTNEIRSNGFWIVGCSSAVSCIISKCVICRKLRSFPQGQKMASLPSDRLEPSPPFTYCAVDLFGPWYIKEGRKELKRYGVLFTCLACRAIHIETANSLSTDSFINSLRRFIAIRGPVRQLRSDRGTNFVGAEHELKQAQQELNEEHIRKFLLNENCDLVDFKMNVPSASHMGGVWERQIRSVRNVIAFLLHNHGTHLDDESLRTFMVEAAAIVNSRPLAVGSINDPLSEPPLSPNLLLTMKSNVILPPPGNFQRPDLYSRKRWRRTQYLVNQFWYKWRSEYVQNLQIRQKWNVGKRNLTVGDIVLLKDDEQPRNSWRLCRVDEVVRDNDGLVRKVKVAIGQPCLDGKGKRKVPITYLERPIHKLILISETEEIPIEEP